MKTTPIQKLGAAILLINTLGCSWTNQHCSDDNWSKCESRATLSAAQEEDSDKSAAGTSADKHADETAEQSKPKRSPWEVIDGWTKPTAGAKHMYKEIDPKDAKAQLDANSNALYLDVRSQAEFAESHAPGAINIPLMDLDANGAMAPNPDFPRIVTAIVPRDAKIIVGCKSGGRSAHAADFMINSGWKDVSNLTGGFHGQSNMLGQTVQPGWLACGLPSTQTPEPGTTYQEIRAKAEAK